MNMKINRSGLLAASRIISILLIALFSIDATAQNVVTIGNGTSDHYYYGPYYRSSSGSSFNYSNYVYLYTSSELGIPPNSIITKVEWYKESGTLTGNNNVFKVWMENTNTSSISTSGTLGNYLSSATSVYSSTTKNFTVTKGWEPIPLDNPFLYTGNNLFIITGHEKKGNASGANRWRYHSASGKAEGTAGSSPRTNSSTFSSLYDDNRPNIRITWEPACPVEFNAGPVATEACANDSAIYSVNVDSADKYQWQVNTGSGWTDLLNSANYDGVQSTKLTVKNTVPSMDGYYYRLIARNTTEACSIESDSAELTIKPTSSSSVVINANPGASVCKDEVVTFYSFFSNGGSNPSFQWYNNGVLIPGANKATFATNQLADNDNIYCIMNSSAECVLSDISNSVNISVNPKVVPRVGLQMLDNGDGTFTFTALPENEGVNPKYEWFRNGVKMASYTGSVITINDIPSTDRIHVDMYSSENCVEFVKATSRKVTTSVGELSNQSFTELSIYPNPNTGQFSLSGTLNESTKTKDVLITVTNAMGQTVYNNTVRASGEFKLSVDLKDNAANGLYILNLFVDGNVISTKFMIRK